ncbi:MAG: T9SS type A sorting domain-containing protein [Candidatus Cloacimonetes bacterium]|nr:T9SS type A sorting domain-containing protein [Candidatus Cloacimonadota bacterium]
MKSGLRTICLIGILLCGFSAIYAQTPGWNWADQLQTNQQSSNIVDTVTDAAGNIISCWQFLGACYLGYPEIPPFEDTSIRNYISKQSSDGSFIWVMPISSQIDNLYKLGVYGTGYIYFTASFAGAITLGGTTLTSTGIGYLIAKLDSEGNYVWVKNISSCGIGQDFNTGIDGNCFLTGSFRDTISFDNITLTSTGCKDMFIARLNPEGVWIWARQATGIGDVSGTYLAAGNAGECYLCGIAVWDADFGEFYCPQPDNTNFWRYVAKYSESGECLWVDPVSLPNNMVYEAGLVQDGLGNAYLLYDIEDYVEWSGKYLKVRKYTASTSSEVFSASNSGSLGATSLAIDSARNLYILGSYYDPFYVGNIPFTDERGAVVIKLNSDYQVSWAFDPSPGRYSRFKQIGVTSEGVPYLTMYTYDAYPVGDFATPPGVDTSSIAGLSSSGTVTWVKSNSFNHIGCFGIDIFQDPLGNNFTCGNYQGAFTRNGVLYPCFGTEGKDIYVARLLNSGAWQWISCAGGEGNDEVNAICVDSYQNSYITGSLTGTMHFGDISVTGNGETDIFIAKLDSEGNWQWAVSFGGTGYDSGIDLAFDKLGNIYVVGSFSETVNFGVTSLTAAGGTDTFVLKLDSSGVALAVTSGGGMEDDYGSGIVITTDSHVAICGNFRLTATFGSNFVNSIGDSDILFAELDGSLEWLSAKAAGGVMPDSASAIGIDAAGDYYVTGYFTGNAVFGVYAINSLGGSDVFVAKVDILDGWIWIRSYGGTTNDAALAIAVANDGTSYITGYVRADIADNTYDLPTNESQAILCISYDVNGTRLWIKQTEASIYAYYPYYPCDFRGAGITLTSEGICTLTGTYSQPTSFGANIIEPNGAYNAFIGTLMHGVDNDDIVQSPALLTDVRAYPNPFKGRTSISYVIGKTTPVRLDIFNVKGQLVKSLGNDTKLSGKYLSDWDGCDANGRHVSSGVYFLSLRTDTDTVVRKLLLMK